MTMRVMSECRKWYWKMLLLRLEGSENGNLDVRRSWVFILCSVGVCLCFSIFSVHPKWITQRLGAATSFSFQRPYSIIAHHKPHQNVTTHFSFAKIWKMARGTNNEMDPKWVERPNALHSAVSRAVIKITMRIRLTRLWNPLPWLLHGYQHVKERLSGDASTKQRYIG